MDSTPRPPNLAADQLCRLDRTDVECRSPRASDPPRSLTFCCCFWYHPAIAAPVLRFTQAVAKQGSILLARYTKRILAIATAAS